MQPVEYLYIPVAILPLVILALLVAIGLKKAKASTHTWRRG